MKIKEYGKSSIPMIFPMTEDASSASGFLKLKEIESFAQDLLHAITAKFLPLILMKVSLLL
jgi:hypothetical protein